MGSSRNLRISLGPLWAVVNSPTYHRLHHSALPLHHDRNFAAILPVWDVLFGTYHHPARDEFPPTGLEDEPEINSFSETLVLPFRAWRKMFRERRDHSTALTN